MLLITHNISLKSIHYCLIVGYSSYFYCVIIKCIYACIAIYICFFVCVEPDVRDGYKYKESLTDNWLISYIVELWLEPVQRGMMSRVSTLRGWFIRAYVCVCGLWWYCHVPGAGVSTYSYFVYFVVIPVEQDLF